MSNYNIIGLVLKEVKYNFAKPERKTLTIYYYPHWAEKI